MERRGGCCIASYGGDGDADVAWKLGRIMLRYRPIAPKPAAGGAPLPAAAPDACRRRRAKRKGPGREGWSGRKARRVVVGAIREEEKKAKVKENYAASASTTVVTLPLMPETPERKEKPPTAPSPTSSDQAATCFQPARVAAGELAPRPAGSWVTVERVTDTWSDVEVGRSCSDEMVRQLLEGDASPGFVSDPWDRVTWTSGAYRRMLVNGEDEEEDAEVVVALATRGMVPPGVACRAFTCRVTVRYACRRRGRVTLAAPCDVWRLGDGGLAWRLDLKAALGLSLG